ncbi:MAG: stage II sporulation protein M [Cyclobacteriaceae bacterium]
MRQAVFVKQNEKKWQEYEETSSNLSSLSSDRVSEIYVHLTEDLAFAKAKYPQSQLYVYLRELTLKIHHHIYRNKPEKKNRFITFWTQELPYELKAAKRNILYAFIIMSIGVCLGALSASNDASFAKMFLGDGYVNMTNENIEKGDPMAVYKGMSETNMFFMITVNNIKVSFFAFILGVIGSLGSAYILFNNGIMLGVFHWLFFSKGLFDETILTIWVHGTLEISAIIIAGAAGLTMGNGLLFPGNFPRMYSFKKAAKRGLKIVLSLVPFFIVAGFLESVVTRKTEWPLAAKLFIIAISLAIVITYLFILPNLKTNEPKNDRVL